MINFFAVALITLVSCIGANDRKSPTTNLTQNARMPEHNLSKTVHDFTLKTIDGKDVSLSAYKGKKILIVNVASQCGYTPQYEELQKFHEKYGDKVAVLGFPANNFGGQEPGSNEEIATFCKKNYGVSFQMFSKISVAGEDQHPLYKWLSTKAENGWNDQAPRWNFCKYLVDENGKLLKYFGSGVKPFDNEIVNLVK
ncbi:MAG: glutathione peroxidase [Thermoflexibacteraceae bacterium]|jgi:glutathione peroxidase